LAILVDPADRSGTQVGLLTFSFTAFVAAVVLVATGVQARRRARKAKLEADTVKVPDPSTEEA
jgi:hypothetical protein